MRVNNDEYLAHYGVLGMKWGRRKGVQAAKLNYRDQKVINAVEYGTNMANAKTKAQGREVQRQFSKKYYENKRDYKIAKVKAGQESYRNKNQSFIDKANGPGSATNARWHNVKRAYGAVGSDSRAYGRGLRKWTKDEFRKGFWNGVRKTTFTGEKDWENIDKYYNRERASDSQKYTDAKIAKGERKIAKIRAKYDRKISKRG